MPEHSPPNLPTKVMWGAIFASVIAHTLIIALPLASSRSLSANRNADLTIVITTHATKSPRVSPTPEPQPRLEGDMNTAASTAAAKNTSGITFPIATERYFDTKELDVIPKPVGEINPTYPTEETSGQHFPVHIEVLIDEHGHVIAVNNRDKLDNLFFKAAKSAFEDATFTPGQKGGRPVPSRLKILVQFE